MDIEETQSTPMDIENAASRLLRTCESGSMPVNVEDSTRIDIEEN